MKILPHYDKRFSIRLIAKVRKRNKEEDWDPGLSQNIQKAALMKIVQRDSRK